MDKQQILVVDDEEINRIILMQMFEDSLDEYELLEAGNGLEAVEQIDKNQNIVLILVRTGLRKAFTGALTFRFLLRDPLIPLARDSRQELLFRLLSRSF